MHNYLSTLSYPIPILLQHILLTFVEILTFTEILSKYQACYCPTCTASRMISNVSTMLSAIV